MTGSSELHTGTQLHQETTMIFDILKASLFTNEPFVLSDWQPLFEEMKQQTVAALPYYILPGDAKEWRGNVGNGIAKEKQRPAVLRDAIEKSRAAKERHSEAGRCLAKEWRRTAEKSKVLQRKRKVLRSKGNAPRGYELQSRGDARNGAAAALN